MPIGVSPLDEGIGDTLPIAPDARPKTGILDNLAAGYESARAGPNSTNVHENNFAKPYYEQIAKDLNRMGFTSYDDVPTADGGKARVPRPFLSPFSFSFNPQHQGLGFAAQEQLRMWEAVAQARLKDPKAFKDIPDHDHLIERVNQDRQKALAQAQDAMERGGTGSGVAAFIGQVAGGWDDPTNYAGGFGGGAGKTVATTIIRHAVQEAGTNAAAAALALPGTQQDAEQHLGYSPTLGDNVKQVAEAAAFGAVIGGGKHVVAAVAPKVGATVGRAVDAALAHAPEPVRAAAMAAALRAGTVSDRTLVAEGRHALNPHTLESTATPDETSALHVVERDADVREASPFHPGSDAHNERRLGAVMDELGVKPLPDLPSPAPLPERAAVAPRHSAVSESAPGGYGAAVIQAEGYNAHAPAGSTITGYGQFSNSTWLGVYRQHFGGTGMSAAQILGMRNDKATAQRMIEAYGQDNGRYLRKQGLEDSDGNKYLAHFLGPRDAAKVLHADPAAPISSVIDPRSFANNRKLLQGKSASELVEWAHKKVGTKGEPSIHADPVGRADAVPDVDYLDDAVPESLPPIEHRSFAPDELTTDPSKMQYKPGGDAAGVTDRLAGEEWNPTLAGKLTVWERNDGQNMVLDGHQRLGLAQRSGADSVDAMVLREADGVDERMAQAVALLKNQETGRAAVDRRTVEGVAKLSNDAMGEVLNGTIDPRVAAEIGHYAADRPQDHAALVQELKNVPPARAGDANVRDTIEKGSTREAAPIGEDPLANTPTTKPAGAATGDSAGAGKLPEQAGHSLDPRQADAQLADGRRLQNRPTAYDEAVAAERASAEFSDPLGKEAQTQTDRVQHDVERALLVFPPRDTRGQGTFYHGARGEVPTLAEGHYNPNNIYGGFETFYTTDAADVASGYGRKHSSAKIYRVEEKTPVSFYDMEARQPESHWQKLFHYDDEALGLTPMAVEEAAQGGQANLREIMDEIRNFSAEEGYTKDDVQELFDGVIHNLSQEGFGGMTHRGGLKTGKPEHTVKIYFDAPNQLVLHDVTPGVHDHGPNLANEADRPQVPSVEPQNPAETASGSTGATTAANAPVIDPQRAFRLSEEGEPRTYQSIVAEMDGDISAVEALRNCL